MLIARGEGESSKASASWNVLQSLHRFSRATAEPEVLAGVSFASRTSFKLKVAFQLSRHRQCHTRLRKHSSPLCSPVPHRKCLERKSMRDERSSRGHEANALLLPPLPPQPWCLTPPSASAAGERRRQRRRMDRSTSPAGGLQFPTAASATPRSSSGLYQQFNS